jgi:hypothetical protein
MWKIVRSIKKKYVDLVSKKKFFYHTAHVHLQLQTFRSDIIWIMSNEIIMLLFSFYLIPTSFRYLINYLRNQNLNMVGGAAVVNFAQKRKTLSNCYLAIKFHKCGIKMTTINILIHVRSIHTMWKIVRSI